MVAMPRPSDPVKAVVRDQNTVIGAHGHLAAQDLFVVVAANRDHGDVATVY